MDRRQENHFPALDGIRGLAALLVLLLHTFYGSMYGYLTDVPLRPWAGGTWLLGEITRYGWGGVDIFFVLSGFLITGILLDSGRGQGALAGFYRRRLARIFPLYYTVLAAIAFTGVSTPFLVLSSLFLMNLLPFFPPGPSYGVVWSLSVEMQFYLLWPFVVRAGSRRQIALAALSLIFACPALREYCLVYHPALPYAWIRMDGMAWGALLALALRSGRAAVWLPRLSKVAMALGAAAFCAVLWDRQGLSLGRQFCWELVCFQVFSFGLVAFGIGQSAGASLFAGSWPRLLGQVSYGVYLIHPAMMMLWDRLAHENNPGTSFEMICVRAVFVSATTFGLAYFSHFYFEKPVAQWLNRVGKPLGLRRRSLGVGLVPWA